MAPTLCVWGTCSNCSCCHRSGSDSTHRRAVAEDPISTDTSRDERVEVSLLASVQLLLEEHHKFVDRDKLSEREGMVSGSGEDAVDSDRPRLVTEQRRHDEGMGEADLASVHDTIAGSLDHAEEVVVRGAEDEVSIGSRPC